MHGFSTFCRGMITCVDLRLIYIYNTSDGLCNGVIFYLYERKMPYGAE